MSIFDLVTSAELAAYWLELTQDREPFLGEELFPDDKKRGLDLKYIKGAKGLPVVLKTSAFDAAAIPRPRIGFEKLSAEISETEEQSNNVERFILKVHKYFDLQELTPSVLNDMVKRVYVHAPQTIDGKRTQEIDIVYDLVGILPQSLLNNEETA